MNAVRFILLGLGVGGVYALAAQGLVLIYRGSGVVNLSQGAMAGAGAFAYFEFVDGLHVPAVLALVAATACGAVLGVLVHLFVMRPLRTASALMRLIATTGVMTVLGQALYLHYSDNLTQMTALFPQTVLHITSTLAITEDRVWILVISVVLSVLLYAFYRSSRFGIATTAQAESEEIVAAYGWQPSRLALINWAVGCALAALAGGLLGPVVSLTPDTATLLIVPVLGAALVGGFRSFPLTFLGGLVIGVGQSLLSLYVSTPGWSEGFPFLILIAVLVVRGRALPARSHLLEHLPKVGEPGRSARTLVVLAVIGGVAALVLPANFADGIAVSAGTAVVGLSVVLVTGYGGQLSLVQYGLAGVGALVAAQMVAVWKVPFWVGLVGAVVVAVPAGLIAAVPALRTRGVNLAVATFGLAVALEAMLFGNPSFTGGISGLVVPGPTLFGLSLDPTAHPGRYAALCVVGLALCAAVVRNVRRGPVGRRLLAVRSNEMAAAALGIDVVRTKLFAFVIGAMIAAVGGVLLAFQTPYVLFSNFSSLNSINIVVLTVIGGVAYLSGSVQGSVIVASGLGSVIVGYVLNIGNALPLIGGILLLVTVVANPDGMTPAALGRIRRWRPVPPVEHHLPAPGVIASHPVPAKRLEVEDIGVVLGGIRAVDGVSFAVEPGEIVGLIGPNGAGKTTCIDLISGFTKGAGAVRLGGRQLTSLSPNQRAKAGLGRSFQSLELFEDETVWDNLATVLDARRPSRHGLDLVTPRQGVLSDAAALAVQLFGLEHTLDSLPTELPTGTRRMLAIARAVAAEPSVLLLDEPAAGLDESESAELGELLVRLARERGVAILLVEHDMSLVMSVCDRVAVLDAGRLIAEGPPDQVASDPRVTAAYLGVPTQLLAEPALTAEATRP